MATAASHLSGGYNNSINGWKALHGNQIEVWSVNGNQFVELDASNGSYGIKQQVANAKAGTYLLTWKHRGRDSAQAGNNAYRAFVYTETNGEKTRVTLKEKHFPVPPLVVSKTAWQPQVLAFMVTDADLAVAGGVQKSLWIAFEPDGNNTYGALIDDVSLLPVDIEVPAEVYSNRGTADNTEKPKVIYKKATELNIATWENSFTTNGFEKKVRWWIRNDTDHFRIHIPMLDKKGAGSIKVTVETKHPSNLSECDDGGANFIL